jgi:hypothetical protein
VVFNLTPAQLAVSDEGLALVDLLERQVSEVHDPLPAPDEHDLLPAAGTGRVMVPPLDQTGHAELVAADLLLCGKEADGGSVRHSLERVAMPRRSGICWRLVLLVGSE